MTGRRVRILKTGEYGWVRAVWLGLASVKLDSGKVRAYFLEELEEI